jgi:hypothetical protein
LLTARGLGVRLARVASIMTKVVIDMTMSLDGFVAGAAREKLRH